MTIKVDLLPSEKRGFGLDPVLIVLLIIVVLCVVVFYFISAWLDADIQRKKDEVKQWDDKITLIKADIPKITKIRDDNNRLRTQIEVIKSLSNDPERYANVLYELGTLIPPNVWVTSVSVDTAADDINMQCQVNNMGNAKPLETIAKFMTDLSTHSRYFKDATLSSTSASSKGAGTVGYSFGLETHYDPVKATKAWNTVEPGGGTASGTTTNSAPAAENPPAACSAPPESSGSPAGSGSPSGSGSPESSSSGSPATAASGSPASSGSPSK
jgi:Tfp pilus assembly protein PilN